MIILHQYPGAWGLTSLSPFCIKVEFFLKASGLSYKVKTEVNPGKGPKGKMPFIEDGNEVVPDSSFIVSHLMRKHSLLPLDIQDPLEKARAVALQAMIEESLYFSLLYSRWVDPDGHAAIAESFKGLFPFFLGRPALGLIRRNLVRQARAQGTGRHTQEEVYALARRQIASLAVLLGENDYFFENKLTYFDATAFSFLITIKDQPFLSPLKEEVLAHANLCRYVDVLKSKVLLA